MKHSIFIIIILMALTKCTLFSDDGKSKAVVSVNHLVKSEVPLICENDPETLAALTDSILSVSKIDSEIEKAIKDSIVSYFFTGKIMSNVCLADEVLFPKKYFTLFGKNFGLDSVKITLTRDFSEMSFNSYGFVTKHGNERDKTELVDVNLNKWKVTINDISNIVTINEDSKTKGLFLRTLKGDTISFPGIQPKRGYLSPIKYVESINVFYSNGTKASNTINSNNFSIRANLLRLSDDLNTAKKI
ncbi:hypothetical protein [Paraflavitalea sp. CAU 1676]|uniref:hypothetical protein n=1 Tax=Paraflavitalea sp. CAU 1676 TaxID=3032598 RepID=UPI0023DC711D|nr:hypothetical protein [Paraflavitalea sp. CAU 1676]MDF2189133.1 hypothetical protein [Paraflavitalea sp. CAU 1676]